MPAMPSAIFRDHVRRTPLARSPFANDYALAEESGEGSLRALATRNTQRQTATYTSTRPQERWPPRSLGRAQCGQTIQTLGGKGRWWGARNQALRIGLRDSVFHISLKLVGAIFKIATKGSAAFRRTLTRTACAI